MGNITPKKPVRTPNRYKEQREVLRNLGSLVFGQAVRGYQVSRLSDSLSTTSRWEASILGAGDSVVLLSVTALTPELADEQLIRILAARAARQGKGRDAKRAMRGRRWRAVLRPGLVDRPSRLRRLGLLPRRRNVARARDMGSNVRRAHRRAPRRARRSVRTGSARLSAAPSPDGDPLRRSASPIGGVS